MDYSQWSEMEIRPILKANRKGQNLQNQMGHAHQNWFSCMHFRSTSTCIIFLSQFYFLTTIIVHGPKEILAISMANKKGAKSSKPERPHPPKLVCMHFTSTSTCMNILSCFYFWKPWTIVHVWKKIWSIMKRSKISKTRKAKPPKLGANQQM